jgi:hypothetical protein
MIQHWTACLTFIALASAQGFSWAQTDSATLKEQIRELQTHQKQLLDTSQYVPGEESHILLAASNLVSVSQGGFLHLADLEQLNLVISEQPGKEDLNKMLKNQRFIKKLDCRSDLINLRVYYKIATSPILVDQLRKMTIAMDNICRLVKS